MAPPLGQPVCKVERLTVTQAKEEHTLLCLRLFRRLVEGNDPPKYWRQSVLLDFRCFNLSQANYLVYEGNFLQRVDLAYSTWKITDL